MSETGKDPRPDAKLQNLPQEELDFLWSLRFPEPGCGKKMTLAAICVQVPMRYGFTIAPSSLSTFYRWLRLRRRIEAAASIADQFKKQLQDDPTVTEEDLDALAAKIFKTEMLSEKNAAGYLAIAKFQLQKQMHQLAIEKLSVTSKSKIEAGLEALLEEIQDNPEALKLFHKLKEVLSK